MFSKPIWHRARRDSVSTRKNKFHVALLDQFYLINTGDGKSPRKRFKQTQYPVWKNAA